MKKINNAQDFPSAKHYAIIIFDVKHIHHEGDERSRTNPGHGYPAYTETVNNFQYLSFDHNDEGKTKWENKIKELYKEDPKRKDFVGFESGPKVLISTNITIES